MVAPMTSHLIDVPHGLQPAQELAEGPHELQLPPAPAHGLPDPGRLKLGDVAATAWPPVGVQHGDHHLLTSNT